jgi:replication-associated recombination protein RarA
MTGRSGPPPTRRGIEFDLAASSLIKCLRRGQEEQAIRWAVELDASGYGQYVWKRLIIAVSEDVGLAEPTLPATIHALHQTALHLQKRKDDRQAPWRLQMIHAVLLLSRADKSRIVDHALIWAYADRGPLEVDPAAIDKHTAAGRRLGRGFAQFWRDGTLLADPATGELAHEHTLADPYRAKAIEATVGEQP